MKTRQKFLSLAIAGLFCVSLSAVAEDIELFNASPDLLLNNGVPNVLIVLDNSANWNANNQKWKDNNNNFIPQGRSEARALRAVISSLPVGAVNVGLMMFVKSSSNPAGGYIRFGIRLMDATNKAALMKILDQLNIGGDDQVAAADADYSAALFEAFKYFGGYGRWVNDASVASSPGRTPPILVLWRVPVLQETMASGTTLATQRSLRRADPTKAPPGKHGRLGLPVLRGMGLSPTARQLVIWGRTTRRIPVVITTSCSSATDTRRRTTARPCLPMSGARRHQSSPRPIPITQMNGRVSCTVTRTSAATPVARGSLPTPSMSVKPPAIPIRRRSSHQWPVTKPGMGATSWRPMKMN